MAKYIDVDKLLEKITTSPFPMDAQRLYFAMRGMVSKAPTEDVVEVKHGYWADDTRKFTVMDKYGYVREEEKGTHTCSICRIGIVGLEHMNYCPNCGAKMDAEGGAE